MVSRASVRIVINDPQSRCVLSIAESKIGELRLNLRSNTKARQLGVPIDHTSDDPLHGKTILNYYYSIHNTDASRNAVNLIKLTVKYDDGDTKEFYYFTTAIKKQKLFSPIYARRCTVLSDESYSIKHPGGTNVSLGAINKFFTLCFAIFVGPPNKPFVVPSIRVSDINIKNVNFTNFNIVIMWSFIPIPQYEAGRFIHFGTNLKTGSFIGVSERKCVEIFKNLREQLKLELIEVVTKAMSVDKTAIQALSSLGFFKRGDIDMKV